MFLIGALCAACGAAPVTPSPAPVVASVTVPVAEPVAEPELSASPDETRPCEGATAIPPEAEKILEHLESPETSHCELHSPSPGAPPLLFVRTMNTVAHDDEGNRLPACTWEVFRTSGGAVTHVATLSACSLRFDKGRVMSLDEGGTPSAPLFCFDEK